jgi:hypothetical protein
MSIFWNFIYEKKKKKDNQLQQVYVNIEQLPPLPIEEEILSEKIIIIDLIGEE